MIIKSVRVLTKGSAARLIRHLLYGDENDEIVLLRGTAADIEDAFADARERNARVALRHWIIAPHEGMTRDQAWEIVVSLGREFGFDPGHVVIFGEHGKSRVADAHDRHWHLLVRQVDPGTGGALLIVRLCPS